MLLFSESIIGCALKLKILKRNRQKREKRGEPPDYRLEADYFATRTKLVKLLADKKLLKR